MPAIVTGDKAIDSKLRNLKDSAQRKIMRPAIAAGLRVVAKAIKQEVPAQYKDAKRAIGSRFNKSKRTGEIEAKAGASVGFKKAQIQRQASKQALRRSGRPGVGIGIRNLFWFILGTAQRTTGTKRIGKGSHDKGVAARRGFTGGQVHSTGEMRPIMPNIVRAGFQKSESAAYDKVLKTARDKIAIEARK